MFNYHLYNKLKKMERKKMIWSVFRDLVNQHSIGSEITRQEMFAVMKQNDFLSRDEYVWMSPKERLEKAITNKNDLYSHWTIDSYRNEAEKVGYLKKSNFPGHFWVEGHFPADYSARQLRRDYDLMKDI